MNWWQQLIKVLVEKLPEIIRSLGSKKVSGETDLSYKDIEVQTEKKNGD